jgi:hypothetical protein
MTTSLGFGQVADCTESRHHRCSWYIKGMVSTHHLKTKVPIVATLKDPSDDAPRGHKALLFRGAGEYPKLKSNCCRLILLTLLVGLGSEVECAILRLGGWWTSGRRLALLREASKLPSVQGSKRNYIRALFRTFTEPLMFDIEEIEE